jgi:hypothetical protein
MDTATVKRMDIVLHVSPQGGFQLFAPADEIEVDQMISIPTGPDNCIDCAVSWVGVPFVDPNMGNMVEFRVVELKHAQAIKDWQEKQLLREFGGDPDVRH